MHLVHLIAFFVSESEYLLSLRRTLSWIPSFVDRILVHYSLCWLHHLEIFFDSWSRGVPEYHHIRDDVVKWWGKMAFEEEIRNDRCRNVVAGSRWRSPSLSCCRSGRRCDVIIAGVSAEVEHVISRGMVLEFNAQQKVKGEGRLS